MKSCDFDGERRFVLNRQHEIRVCSSHTLIDTTESHSAAYITLCEFGDFTALLNLCSYLECVGSQYNSILILHVSVRKYTEPFNTDRLIKT
jgi:hypothetical protein